MIYDTGSASTRQYARAVRPPSQERVWPHRTVWISPPSRVRPVSREIYSLEILCVDGHEKKGVYVPSHLHLNLTYLLEADPEEPLRARAGENRDVKWLSPEGAVEASTEPWFRERIYSKLNAKLVQYR